MFTLRLCLAGCILLFSQVQAESRFDDYATILGSSFYGVTTNKAPFHPETSFTASVFSPLMAQADQVLFADGRLKFDLSKSTDHHEMNLGLVHRKAFAESSMSVVGLYAFWDVSHVQDQTFVNQLTMGAEYITSLIHTNVNFYFTQPNFTINYVAEPSSSLRSFNKHYFITNQTGQIATIKPLSGADAMLRLGNYPFSRGFISVEMAYKFFMQNDFITLQGPKAGLMYTFFSYAKEFTAEMYTAYDSFHGNSFGLTLSTRALSKPWAQLKPMARILSRPVVRDVDIQMAYLALTQPDAKNNKGVARVTFQREKTNQEIIAGLFDFYVINLDRDQKRLTRFSDMMKDHNIEFHRKKAIDGYDLNITKLQKDGVVTPRAASVLHRGEIAVALSQKSVWKDNTRNKKPFIAVFEDDVRVPQDFSTKLTQLVEYIRDYDFDVLFLGRTTWAQKLCQNQFGWEHHGCVNVPTTAKIPGPIIDAPFSWGAFAYVASTKSLPKLVSAYQVIDRPIDAQWWLPEYQLKMATTNPLWMDQYSTDLYDSHSYGTL